MRDPSTYRGARRDLARELNSSGSDIGGQTFRDRFALINSASSVRARKDRDVRRHNDKVAHANQATA